MTPAHTPEAANAAPSPSRPVSTSPVGSAIACREGLGLTLVFTPLGGVTLRSGEGTQTGDRFNTGTIRQLFCPTSGVEFSAYGTMPDGTETAAVNVDSLDGVDPRALQASHFEGTAGRRGQARPR